MTTRTVQAGLTPAGFQRIALNSTAVSLNSTTRRAHVLDISAETQNARFRADGISPTASTGVLLPKDTRIRLKGFNGTSALKFCAATAGAVLQVQGWRYE